MQKISENEVKLGNEEAACHATFHAYLDGGLGIHAAVEKTQDYANRLGYEIAPEFWEWLEF